MRLIKGNRFKINGIEYQVLSVTFRSGERESYTFKTCDWDKPVVEYTMIAKDFESKVGINEYLSLT